MAWVTSAHGSEVYRQTLASAQARLLPGVPGGRRTRSATPDTPVRNLPFGGAE